MNGIIEVPFPSDHCLHTLFEQQAEQQPNAAAVIFKNKTLTYSQLNQRANQLAHYLIQLGVGPDVPVAIALQRSFNMVIGLYGILKAGGAYVPLDPTYPPSRLAMMLEDVGAPVLLTQTSLADSLQPQGAKVVLIDQDWPQIGQQSSYNPTVSVTPHHLAYIIYTSGSTGRPKGAMLNHRGRVNNFADFNCRYNIGAADRVLGLASLSFDMSAYDIFGMMSIGGTTVIVEQEALLEPAQWARLMSEHNITIWHSVPALLGMLVDHLEFRPEQTPESLRLVLLGGDWIPVALPDRLKLLRPGIQAVSMGGATECSMDSTIFDINDPSSGWKSIPYGYPMANQTGFVLDEQLNEVDEGEEGELYFGGIGVGRGYFNQPSLTAERFIPHPNPPVPGARLYRTGDLVREFPGTGGNLELLGRIDFQVKIRGYRVEIGEIEATVRKHPGVKESVIQARRDLGPDQRLVAYLLPEPSYSGEDNEAQTLQADQISEWQMVYDTAYSRPTAETDPTFNIVSWDSSYTGRPIPPQDMRQWVDQTVTRIQRQQPRRVMEIGCGTGLLLFRIAPNCDTYLGTDFSQTALDYVNQHLTNQGLSNTVSLERRLADNFSNLETDSFDAVVLNSIVVDFPSLDYLMQVLKGAVRIVRPGGTIFVGDVRSLPSLELFHTSVQTHRAPADLPVNVLRQRIRRQMRLEEELTLDPAFFAALPHHIPGIGQAEIQLKRGDYHNELSKFRYDVTLHVEQSARLPEQIDKLSNEWLDWQTADLTPTTLRSYLTENNPEFLGLANVPNSRTWADAKLAELLETADDETVVGDLRPHIKPDGIEPEAFWQLADELPYDVDVQFPQNGRLGTYDVLLLRRTANKHAHFPQRITADPDRPLNSYANNPLQAKISRQLIPQVRSYLENRLPDYMVPSAFVLMDAFPLSPNGKINRRAFPKPDTIRPDLAEAFVPPRTPVEAALATIWLDRLGLEQVGVNDQFVALGGNSLLATQVVSRIRDLFQLELPLSYGFNSTIAMLADHLTTAGARAGLDVEEIAKTHLMTSGGDKSAVSKQTISPRSPNKPLPLSFLQEGLWFLEQLAPGEATYNVPVASRLSGPLNLAALEQAINEMTRRHEILRTTFQMVDGRLVQQVADYSPKPLEVVDLSGGETADIENEALRLATAEAQKPIDLATGPLFRAFLIRLNSQNHILALNIHHIITDGWSMGVMTNELTRLYTAYDQGNPSPLPKLPIQYGDYTFWQHAQLQGERLATLESFWQDQLSGSPFILDLPVDFTRPEVLTGRGNHLPFALESGQTAALRRFSRENGVTLFATLLAAFKVLLAQYANQNDIIVGTPIANRNHSELENLIGYFVNLLPLRSQLKDEMTFPQLVQALHQTTIAANEHQELPFGKVVTAVQPPRSPGRNPIFQVELTLLSPEHAPPVLGYGFRSPVDQRIDFGNLTLHPLSLESGVSKFDLTVLLWDMPDEISGTFEYSTKLFKMATIENMVVDYGRILTHLSATPEVPLTTIKGIIKGGKVNDGRRTRAKKKMGKKKLRRSIK